jgi:hypothetical protein
MVRKPIDEANRILQEAGSGNTSAAAKAKHAPRTNSSEPQKRDTKAQRNERLKILVKILQGRFIEVYCNSELVDCLVINEPDVAAVNGLSAEQLLERVLPKVYADIHCQNLKVAVGEALHLTAADVSERVAKLELFDALALNRPASERIRGVEALRAGLGVSR